MISKFKSLGKVLRTVSHLKPIQVAYQLKNRFTQPGPLTDYIQNFQSPERKLSFTDFSSIPQVLKIEGNQYVFTFLNQEKTFVAQINWGEASLGKLWNYNLQYLDFLRQQDIPEKTKQSLLYDLYERLEKGGIRLEPYPVSLRVMNIIRYLNQQPEPDNKLQQWIYAEITYLSKNLEYHLLGNHLLENGFALLMGGYFFNHLPWIKTAEKLLVDELKEQILDDGAHFELSPMYHQIVLFRVLEVLDYLPKESLFYASCHAVAQRMLSWLKTITFKNGDIPHFNDSSDGITFTTALLLDWAYGIGMTYPYEGNLLSSGYRKLSGPEFELVADVHGTSPDYQPGHAHADSLSFVLHIHNQPFVVDMGISTYQIGSRRTLERRTQAHNTVTINDRDTAEVWSGFRVGRRPKVALLESNANNIKARLTYEKFIHERSFSLDDNELLIHDQVNSNELAVSRLYFHPNITMTRTSEKELLFSNGVRINILKGRSATAHDYLYNQGYNLQLSARYVEISFEKECLIQIILTK